LIGLSRSGHAACRPVTKGKEVSSNHLPALRTAFSLACLAATAHAEFDPEWTAKLGIGSSLSTGLTGMTVDAAGNTYVTATTDTGGKTDVFTAAYAKNGLLLWSHVFNGATNGHDQARGIAVGANGVVWVCGNTPNSFSYANILLLAYDAATGALLHQVQVAGPNIFTSEHAASIAVDGQGDVFIGGGTVGDGADGLVMKFDANGSPLWREPYDGPAFGPFSQDTTLEVQLDGNGDLVALHYGVMGGSQPDYVVTKYASQNGATLWHTTWGVSGGDYPSDLELAANGDVFVTGLGILVSNQFSTIKLRGTDGALLWQTYVVGGNHPAARSLAIDGIGGVYVTGSVDPDGDKSNQNDNYFTMRLDATTGALVWTHLYGANCVGCLDTASAVRADSAGSVYVMGRSSSAPYSADQLLFVLDAGSGSELDRSVTPLPSPEVAQPGRLRLDSQDNLLHAGQTYNANTGAISTQLQRYTSRSTPFYQLFVTPLVSGVTATFAALHATPGATQFLIYSATGPGIIPVPSFGVTLGISNPALLIFGPADASGQHFTNVFVPPGLTGFTAWFQAVEFGKTTQVIQRTVQ
jgi:hypothetical protein